MIIIEDDQIAELATSALGSLISDARLQDRVIYIRSFAKTIAPDLRLAAALASPRLSGMLAEAKSFADGWSSRLAQRALALALNDPETDELLQYAKSAYGARRSIVLSTLRQHLSNLDLSIECRDGLNVWISLPQGFDASEVVERAAKNQVLVVSGEPFFLHPGNDSWIRMSISQLTSEEAELAANRLANTIVREIPFQPSTVPM
jgi:GntR family transcriptional regulator/MocR family aminotransferase